MTPASPFSDTIFALASGRGRAGIAVVRVSGPDAGDALSRLMGTDTPPAPRLATRAKFSDPDTGDVLDDGLGLWFPAPASFTGEDVAELHVHGGPAVIAALLSTLGRIKGLRPADAGEFSRRAFELGKLDLTSAEGLADLIEAETEAQRRQAQRQAGGELARLYEDWRSRLVRLLAYMEADMDFTDEDLPDSLMAEALTAATVLDADIETHLNDNHRAERLRDGLSLAIIGPPNAGKSSLLNLLARRDAAIVSDIAGTTRDVIEVHLDLGGYPLIIADTAGLRDVEGNEVEGEGVRRSRQRAAHADLKLAVLDASAAVPDPETVALINDSPADTLVVYNKGDLGDAPDAGPDGLTVSVKTGDGIETLMADFERAVSERLESTGGPAPTRERHRRALEDCRAALARAQSSDGIELAAEDLRLAARALGSITGRIDVEDLLDVIFGEFCIGK
ncbi:MAG: tRNA uridine-5-carboxymethylaminomethyl(34) synthesis GTPase MnmE [Rhodospirillaceae bacterium]|jgi:tRNA modification GTPase|nr:tRNA uridine-5-carboxymethylaminomethyl(34) synthesis GTPase MnmE [Rhodospirillaceae bacterium]MBT4220180.1 tRNA uridine-5-carboxymethylaminomethyl(34) synthesis GTPase MnmE [Rhodospirillaceae bacterium]MBT5013697.1 tRNA uridine-5-carboxymethylaminomethyl(34) synthesis GTPase MnmE [Rhodospirillaceae bacterium]MBT5308479.1 tRNA uridine-5-carboxymethylaminomethyl(34) synthesis GTPase MnmE [Rhodospirillaceae bacterium]MBT6406679.1 tRNA uridine-5-carboxymethylaminomethyl(34) synthesis GTPase Mnm